MSPASPCASHPTQRPPSNLNSWGDTSAPSWHYCIIFPSYLLSQSLPLPPHIEALTVFRTSINSILEDRGQRLRFCSGALFGRTSQETQQWGGALCDSVPRWSGPWRSSEFPRALGSSQGDLLFQSMQARQGWAGQRPPWGLWDLPCLLTMAWVHAPSLTSVSSVCTGWGWSSWHRAHSVCMGGPWHLAAASAPLSWVSLMPQLIHSPSLLVCPHVTASCGGDSHSCRQEECPQSSSGEEKTELVPWTCEPLGQRGSGSA